MAHAFNMIGDLHPLNTTSVIRVRCVRAYHVRNARYINGISKSEVIFHDSQGVRIHATFPRNTLRIGSKIVEGGLFDVQNFIVTANNMRFKTTAHRYRLIMLSNTKIVDISDPNFPSHMFSFKTFEQIYAIQDVVAMPLFDVIGVVVKRSECIVRSNYKFIELVLEDDQHRQLHCVLWNGYVEDLLLQTDVRGKKVPIVILQFCRAIMYRGEVRTSTVFDSSKVLLDKDVKESDDFRDRIFGDETFIPPITPISRAISTNYFEYLKVKSIGDLLNLEDGCHWICARIEGVKSEGEWFYMACKVCGRKVSMNSDSFYCKRCDECDDVADQRLMLKIDVVDSTSNTSLLLWDRESVQLLGKKSAVLHAHDIENKLIGQTVLFQIQLRNENQSTCDHLFIVNRICNDRHLIENYTTPFSENIDSTSTYQLLDAFSENDGKIEKVEFISKQNASPMDVDVVFNGSVRSCLEDNFSECNAAKKVKVCIEEKKD